LEKCIFVSSLFQRHCSTFQPPEPAAIAGTEAARHIPYATRIFGGWRMSPVAFLKLMSQIEKNDMQGLFP
jgi:hypothetical protein